MGIRMRRIDSQEKGERREGVQGDRRNERREKIGRHEGRGKHKEEKNKTETRKTPVNKEIIEVLLDCSVFLSSELETTGETTSFDNKRPLNKTQLHPFTDVL